MQRNKLYKVLLYAVVAGVCIVFTHPVYAATFVVNSTGDESDVTVGDGICLSTAATCTLRAAIQETNALAGADTINFNIPTSDPNYDSGNTLWTITANKSILTGGVYKSYDFTDSAGVVIDGTTQPGYINRVGGVIKIYSPNIPSGSTTILGGNLNNTTINSLQLVNNYATASACTSIILFSPAASSFKLYNSELSATNYTSSAGGCWAIADLTNDSIVQGNIIRNYKRAIRATSTTAGHTITIKDNKIYGANSIATGSQLYNTAGAGVDVLVDNNIISGHQDTLNVNETVDQGISFQCRTCTYTNNQFIDPGVAASGYSSMPLYINAGVVGNIQIKNNQFLHNNTHQIIDWSLLQPNQTINIENNVFSGQNLYEIALTVSSTTNLTITGNTITKNYGGVNSAIFVRHGNTQITNNVINSLSKGIIIPSDSTGTAKLQNNIITTTNLGIDLQGGTEDSYGVTANDANDVDTGANNLMNMPIIQMVQPLGSNQYKISGDIDFNASEIPITIEICRSNNNASGHGGCAESLGFVTTLTRSFSTTVVTTASNPDFTAIATNASGATSEFGQYADAVPVFDGTNYVITVNTTADEDNVSTTYYNSGTGQASGGGLKGPNGVANGRTSLREAILVANAHTGSHRIVFNIPTSDANWNTIQFPNAFKITPTSSYVITNANLTLDGNSQALHTGNTAAEVLEPNSMPVIGNATTGPEIIINGQSLNARIFGISAANVTIDRIGIFNANPLQSGGGRVIELLAGADNFLLQNSTIANSKGGALTARANVSNMQINHNVFRNIGLGDRDVFELQFGSTSGASFTNNQFIQNDASALAFFNQTVTQPIIISGNLFKANGANTTESASQIYDFASPSLKLIITNNIIVGGYGAGVLVRNGYMTIQNNLIYDNAGLNIDLSFGLTQTSVGDGVTINDAGDIDTGPNDFMNFPVITKVEYVGGGTYKIYGDIDHQVSEGPITIEVCEANAHSSGHGGCIKSLGFTTANSPWQLSYTFAGDTGHEGRRFTALATNTSGATSEFAANFSTITFNIPPVITSSAPTPAITETPVETVTPSITPSITETTTPQPTSTPQITQTSGELKQDDTNWILYICLCAIPVLALIAGLLFLSKRSKENGK